MQQSVSYFFSNAPAPTDIYTLSLHDALPIYHRAGLDRIAVAEAPTHLHRGIDLPEGLVDERGAGEHRSEEHTSELQSQFHLVCRLLLEKKKSKLDKNDTRANNAANVKDSHKC